MNALHDTKTQDNRQALILSARSEAERVAEILALPCINACMFFLATDDSAFFLATRPKGTTALIAVSTRSEYVNTYTRDEAEGAAALYNSLRPSWDHVTPVPWRECYETHRERMVMLALSLEIEVA